MIKPITWVAIVATIASFIIRFVALNQTTFANGWDAYFYLIQVQSLLETSRMHSEEWTLFYPLLLILSSVFNHVVAVKILSSLLAASITLVLVLLAYTNSKSIILSVVLASWSIASPELTYFAAQWPKNLLGIVLLSYLLLFLSRDQLKWALLFLVLGFFGHRLTAILGIVSIVIWYGSNLINSKRLLYIILGIAVSLCIIHFIPGLFSFYDLERLTGLMGSGLTLPPLGLSKLIGEHKISWFWESELWILQIAGVAAVPLSIWCILKNRPNKLLLTVGVLFIILWFPFYNYTLDGAAYRFIHSGALLIPILFISVIGSLIKFKYFNAFGVAVSTILLIGSLFTFKSYSPEKHDPPYKLFNKLTVNVQEHWIDNKPELVIAHKSLAEYFTYSSKVDSMPWMPEYTIDNDRLYRIAYIPINQLTLFYLKDRYTQLSGSYIYLKESDWQYFIKQIELNESDEVLAVFNTWKNPNQIRPSFLLKN